jgi:hypothetical protein
LAGGRDGLALGYHWPRQGPQPGDGTCRARAIKFLAAQAKISELDAYALCSVAVSFRVTQVVDIVRGIHALIPKAIFAPDLRREMTVV